MSQLYARVFTQILDSSIAEDFQTRHVFEDLFKLCTKDGIIDMTRTAIARRLNLPLESLSPCIDKLESPDPNSRDPDHHGRRIERLDEHRDWGWRILNWPKYDALRSRADVAVRVARHRISEPTEPFIKPTVEAIRLQCAKIGLPEDEAESFYHHYEANGWRIGGKTPMRSWHSALVNWRKNYQAGTFRSSAISKAQQQQPPLFAQKKAIESQIEKHPANKDYSGYHSERVTQAQRDHLKKLRERQVDIEKQEAGV